MVAVRKEGISTKKKEKRVVIYLQLEKCRQILKIGGGK